jgi:hypothetical protein
MVTGGVVDFDDGANAEIGLDADHCGGGHHASGAH